jgi:L,D-transpeptidase ErfK/SrfK
MLMSTRALCLAVAAAIALTGCDRDGALSLPGNGDSVVGAVQKVRLDEPAPPIAVARRYSVALNELQRSNSKLRGIHSGKLAAGTEVTVPTLFVLPDAPRRGIVVNIAERRLYYYPGDPDDEPSEVYAFAAAVGRDEWETPVGETHVAEMIEDPPWYPPQSIREEQAEEGKPLPEVVPPGPENPLGKYALRLGWNKHLIHGTNAPQSIGGRVSHGCVRLYPEDMERLFDEVREGTPVRMVDQPVKLGTREGQLYLEVHASPARDSRAQQERIMQRIAAWLKEKPGRRIDWIKVERTLGAAHGRPVRISAT